VGGLAAELEQDAGDIAGRGLSDLGADAGGPGEGDLVDAGVSGQRAAHRRAESGHDVEYARREAGLFHPGSQLDGGRGRVVARLGHHRAAGRQRWRELPAQQQER
jgi:hypothetical protein